MRFRILMAVGVAGLILLGCSASEPVIPSATVQREIPLGQREVTTTRLPDTTVVTTTVVMTTIGATTIGATTTVVVDSVPPATVRRPLVVGPSPDDLEALFAATILADQVQREQLDLPPDQRDRAALVAVMTPIFADAALATFARKDQNNRRYAAGTIDRVAVLRVENYSVRGQTADVIFCRQNNGREYDTKGTQVLTDDTLIQEDLEIVSHRTQMIKTGGVWKRASDTRERAEQCSNAFD